eukprot:8208079-Pyramimonas_sp.AAC.1
MQNVSSFHVVSAFCRNHLTACRCTSWWPPTRASVPTSASDHVDDWVRAKDADRVLRDCSHGRDKRLAARVMVDVIKE